MNIKTLKPLQPGTTVGVANSTGWWTIVARAGQNLYHVRRTSIFDPKANKFVDGDGKEIQQAPRAWLSVKI